jgi:(2R)-ethylmalonyl-CoA mutase
MNVPVVVGGIIPPDDENALRNMGVARVYTPKDFALDGIIADVAGLAAKGG